jgi:hypothetical protein
MKSIKVLFLAICLLLVASVSMAATGISWTAPSTGVPTGYTINFSDGTNSFNKSIAGTVTSATFVSMNLNPGKTYTITVSAYNAAGVGSASNTVSYTVPSYTPPADVLPTTPQTAPGAPTAILQ